MSAGLSTGAAPADRVLVVTRVFDAPRSVVFKAWTDREHLAHWFGPRGFELTFCKMDLRPGGSYRFGMHLLDSQARLPDRVGFGRGSADRAARTTGIGKPPEPALLSGPYFKTGTQMSSHGRDPLAVRHESESASKEENPAAVRP